ncbi:MAG: hypothetical protein ACOCVF_01075 [bacterium]
MILIKKEIDKQEPDAFMSHIKKGVVYYYADLEQCRVKFEVPFYDMGDGEYKFRMKAKQLTRWLTKEVEKSIYKD